MTAVGYLTATPVVQFSTYMRACVHVLDLLFKKTKKVLVQSATFHFLNLLLRQLSDL
jgi:hypothetical protein